MSALEIANVVMRLAIMGLVFVIAGWLSDRMLGSNWIT